MRKKIQVDVGGAQLVADQWCAPGPLVVFLHAGVCDRRSWYAVADQLEGAAQLVAYDNRGFGESPVADAPFRRVDDLLALLDQLGGEPAWLVGPARPGHPATQRPA